MYGLQKVGCMPIYFMFLDSKRMFSVGKYTFSVAECMFNVAEYKISRKVKTSGWRYR